MVEKILLTFARRELPQLSTHVEPFITPVHERNMADDDDVPSRLTLQEFFDRVRELRERATGLETNIGGLRTQNIDILQDPDWFSQEGLDPLCTARQEGMAWYYETFGVKGLAYMIVQIAAEEAREEHRTWRVENGQATQGEDAASAGTAAEEALPSIETLGVEDVEDQPLRHEVLQDSDEEDETDDHEGSCHPFAGRWSSSQKPVVQVRRSTSVGDVLSPAGRQPQVDTAVGQQARDEIVREWPQITAGLHLDNLDQVPNSTAGASSPVPSAGGESVLDLEGVHGSWKLILEDWVYNDGWKLLYYLSQLHPRVTVTLIKGDLALKMQDSAFSSDVQAHLTPSDRQGTYAVFVSVQRTSNQPSVSNAGKGLTVRQIVQAYEAMRWYIDVEDPTSRAHAKQVEQFSGSKKLREELNYRRQHRYGSGTLHDSFIHHREWLAYVKLYYWDWYEHFKDSNQDHVLDIPLDRCPVYVGFGKGVVRRSKDHSNHSGSISPILGLLCAVLKLRHGELFQTTTSTWQMLKTVHTSHIGFDEKLTIILCSAYPWDVGLSTAYASINRGQSNKYDDRDYQALQQNAEDIELSGLQKVNLEESDEKIQIAQEQFRDALKHGSKHKMATAAVESELAHIADLNRGSTSFE